MELGGNLKTQEQNHIIVKRFKKALLVLQSNYI